MSAKETEPGNKSESLSLNDWQRLKRLLNAVPTSRQTLEEYQRKFDSFFDDNSIFHEFSARIQNFTIRLRQRKVQIERARNRVRNAQHRLTVAIEENDKQVEHQRKLEEEVDSLKIEIETLKTKNQTSKNSYVQIRNELVFRRRFLLDQLYRVYFVDDPLVRYFKRDCSCSNYECIGGLHLPAISERADHLQFQVGGAISHLVNLLISIAKTLDVPLRNPLVFCGSHSVVFNRVNGKSFDFFQTPTKASKEHVDVCLKLLCQNVIQLQSNCGCLEYKADANDPRTLITIYPISRLRETLQKCIGHYPSEIENDQSSNLFLCSSIIPRSNPATDRTHLSAAKTPFLDLMSTSSPTGLTANST